MQALSKTFSQITGSLGRLSINAKLLVGALMVILVMALFLVSQYAGRSDMLPLGLPSSAEVRAKAVGYLEQARVEYEDRGNDIYVPASRRFAILGQLSQQQIVAADEIDFNALIDLQTNPFISSAQARQMWLTAKMNVLSAMIAAREDVATARVIIDQPPGQLGLGRSYLPPTASVMVTMRGTPMSQEIADVVGHLVAGAHAGLKPENVAVTDVRSRKRFTPRDDNAFTASSYLENKKKTEDHFRRMIEDTLAHIPGAVVTVNALIKNTLEESSERTIEDPKIGPKSTETRDFASTNDVPSREAGVMANVGGRIPGRGRTSQVTESITKDEKEAQFGKTDRIIKDPTGYALQVNAMVGLPKSYFVKLYQEERGDGEAVPDSSQLDAVVQRETTQWEADLALLIKTEGLADAVAGEVRVRMIHDFEVALGGPGGGGLTPDSESAGLNANGGLIQNIGLITLALLSVVMMFLMVKRAGGRTGLPSATELAGVPPDIRVEEADIVGEAEEGAPALEGLELDDATMRTQQLLEQINSMIEEGPDEAAGLLQRWVAADAT